MTYYTKRTVSGDVETVAADVEDALADEGFGVLCDIDVAGTLKKKLGVEDHREYRILGACNPALAHDALAEEIDLGTLLPCNVVVYEADVPGQVVVSAVDPEVMLSVVDNPDLDPIAEDVKKRLDTVLDAVEE